MNAKDAEKNMIHNEKYLGIPDKISKISLAQALDKVDGSPIYPHTIKVKHLLHKFQNEEPKPAWVIFMYGISPIPFDDGREIVDIRNVVNATTGHCFFVTSYPRAIINDK